MDSHVKAVLRVALTMSLVSHLGACENPPASWPSIPGGMVAYVAPGPRSLDLWAIPPYAGAPIRLTKTPRAHEFDPAWSPDGHGLAFARSQAGGASADIWMMSLDGLELNRLTHDGNRSIDRQPAWSPDGTRIAWVRSYPSRSASEIWIMNSNGAQKHRLLPGSASHYDGSPDWSPDGRTIVFTTNRAGPFPQIFTVESDGSNLRRLTTGSAMNGNPVWSPDGRSIAFDRSPVGGDPDLWLMDADGTGMARLTRGTAGEAHPSWSPDRTQLVFVRYPSGGGPTDVFLAPQPGATHMPLTKGPAIELAPDWGRRPPDLAAVHGRSSGPPRSLSAEVTPRSRLAEKPFANGTAPAKADSTAVTRDVRLREFRSHGSQVYALDVRLDGKATLDVALASDGLGARLPTSRIAARHGAIAAVNGDFALPSGKPVHPFAEDGDLKLSSLNPSANFAVSFDQAELFLGRPVYEFTANRPGGGGWPFDRWNAGIPSFGEIAAYSAAAGREDRPPRDACAARLLQIGDLRWAPGGDGVASDFRVDVARCSGTRLSRGGGVILAAWPSSEGAYLLSSLRVGERLTLTWSFGWPRVADSIGGFPRLLRDGSIRVNPCGGLLCQPHPRTGVGFTSERHVLIVVVDGRQDDSRGVTLVEFARIFRDLGAIAALNLDGGGSTTMVVEGSILNDPSGEFERPTSSALLVLPGQDEDQSIES